MKEELLIKLGIFECDIAVNKTYFLPGETLEVYVFKELIGEFVKLFAPNGDLVAEKKAKLGISLRYTFSKEDPPGTWKVACGKEEREIHLLSPTSIKEVKPSKILPKTLWIPFPKSYLSSLKFRKISSSLTAFVE